MGTTSDGRVLRVAWRSTRCARVARRSLVISEGEADKRKAMPAPGLFFCTSSFPQAGGNSGRKKPASTLAFRLCGETRFELGDQKSGYSLAGCCITTLPPLQDMSAFLSRACDLRRAKIVNPFSASKLKEFVSATEHRLAFFDR